MRKKLIASAFVSALLAVQATDAAAGGSTGSIGVGGELTLLGIGGPSVNYDGGAWHAGGFLGYTDGDLVGVGDASFIEIGGRFYYHVHTTASSDFGVGGQIGLQHISVEEPAEDADNFFIDMGAQIRAFIVPNVAISFSLGIGLVADDEDNDGFALTTDLVGNTGLHYYFFGI